jgi:MoaD family protein
MAKVRVRMFATIREAAGSPTCEIEAIDMPDLLNKLGNMFGDKLARALNQADNDPDRLVILVNGRNLRWGGTRRREFLEGDEVAIFPPVSGG